MIMDGWMDGWMDHISKTIIIIPLGFLSNLKGVKFYNYEVPIIK
jgi:hypothetical protein